MRGSRTAVTATFLAALALASCGKENGAPDSPEPPAGELAARPARTLPVPGAADAVPPPPSGSGTGETAMLWQVPAGWVEQTPSSSMRKAQYKVPGLAGDGECVVFYFGPGQGGDPTSNAMRWAGQFQHPDGIPPEKALKTTSMKVGPIDVLQVEVRGTYTGMTTTMAPAEAKTGYMLLGAVAQGPDSNWFFKLTGPEATVESQRASFEGLLRSLKSGSPAGTS